MKILLVAPDISAKQENQNDFVYFSRLINKSSKKQTGHKLGVLPLALPTLAALTPPEFDVRIIDENIEDIDFNTPADIVGITFLTCYAPQGYALADKFRNAGVYVALGGVHVTMCEEEALQHADTVFVGEADDTWEVFLDDFKKGNPKRVYKPEKRPDLTRLGQTLGDRQSFLIKRQTLGDRQIFCFSFREIWFECGMVVDNVAIFKFDLNNEECGLT